MKKTPCSLKSILSKYLSSFSICSWAETNKLTLSNLLQQKPVCLCRIFPSCSCPSSPSPSSAPFPPAASRLIGIVVAKCDNQFANFNIVKNSTTKAGFVPTWNHHFHNQSVMWPELLCARSKKVMILGAVKPMLKMFETPCVC